MIIKSFQDEKRFQKYNDNIQKITYQCKNCGRKRIIRPNNDRTLCDHCGHYIYKNEMLEKKYKFKEQMQKALKERKK